MILSFSVPAMLPYLRAGIDQAQGKEIGDARVKRQTIRARGPRAEKLLAWDTIAHTHPYDLHLWWKSRTPQRKHLGTIRGGGRIYAITILHSFTQSPGGPKEQCLKIDGCHQWDEGDSCYFWGPEHGGEKFAAFAHADGFESPEAFRDYFVPNLGDKFEGVMFKW